MREKDITPEIIRLSKEIAELWRMEIYKGCWIVPGEHFRWVKSGDKDKPLLVVNKTKPPNSYLELENYKGSNSLPCLSGYFIPIPDIGDCLEKLRELGYFYLVEYVREGYALLVFDEISEYGSISKDSLPTHEALLSALLEVLKNE